MASPFHSTGHITQITRNDFTYWGLYITATPSLPKPLYVFGCLDQPYSSLPQEFQVQGILVEVTGEIHNNSECSQGMVGCGSMCTDQDGDYLVITSIVNADPDNPCGNPPVPGCCPNGDDCNNPLKHSPYLCIGLALIGIAGLYLLLKDKGSQ